MQTEKNCLSYWFPILQKIVPVPETVIVRTSLSIQALLDGKAPEGFADFVGEIRAAAQSLGGFPCFLRTGHTSGKHYWTKTCFVPSADEIGQHVYEIVEFSELCSLIGLPYDVWAVRKLLPLKTAFTAFGGFPVNKERRYFIADGRVQCHHPYWPEKAVAEGSPKDLKWAWKLSVLNEETDHEVKFLTAESLKVAAVFEGAWSLDWAQDVAGNWYAIDMAAADDSFHDPTCPNCPEDQKLRYAE